MSFGDIAAHPVRPTGPVHGTPSRGSGGGPDKPSLPMGSPSHGAGGGPDKPIHPPGSTHPPTTPGHGGTTPPPFTQTQQSIWDYMNNLLSQWGLGNLQNDLRRLVTQGETSADTLTMKLRDTDAYKKRFSGNAVRIANGYDALNEHDYVQMEGQYRQTLQKYGISRTSQFYGHDFMADMIGKDLSVSEVDDRAKIAHDQWETAPAQMKSVWQQFFGTRGDMIGHLLDPNRATEDIKNQSTQVGIGYAAQSRGLTSNQARAAELQQHGVTADQADKVYAQIAQSQQADASIAGRFGTTFDQHAEEQDLLLGDAEYAQRRAAMYGEERGLFTGSAGQDSSSLGTSQSTY